MLGIKSINQRFPKKLIESDDEMNMLAFFAVRGILPEQIIGKGVLTRKFYYHVMELYYKERNEIMEILLKVLGGDK